MQSLPKDISRLGGMRQLWYFSLWIFSSIFWAQRCMRDLSWRYWIWRTTSTCMWRFRKCYVCVYMLLKGFNIAVAFPLPVMKALIMQGQSSDWQPDIKNPIPGHICAKQREARTGYIKDIISTCFGKKFTMQQACIWNQTTLLPLQVCEINTSPAVLSPFPANACESSVTPHLLRSSYYTRGY